MLRHKLMLRLGSLIVLLVVTAIVAIIVLNGIVEDLNRLGAGATGDASVAAETMEVHERLRWTGLGLGLVFLIVINVAILVLLRAASMILRPVDQLIEGSRRLAREEFDHRVEIAQNDEFDELARAQNQLASELQLNERRRIETLQQVATTLRHELNNAISIIDMQLAMVARRSGDDPAQHERLSQIHATLRRMSFTLESLSRIRRIVLTDYVDGVKMLDLERSTQDAPPEPRSAQATTGTNPS